MNYFPEENSMLDLLDKCFTKSCYHAGFKVSEELLPNLESKVGILQNLASGELEKLHTLEAKV